MYIPKIQFDTIEDYITDALEEGNYVTGYKKIFQAVGLSEDELADGLEVIRQAVNATQALYRFRTELKALKDRRWVAGTDVVALEKEIRKVEHKIVARVYDIICLREPLDEFLVLTGIPVRDKYNKSQE